MLHYFEEKNTNFNPIFVLGDYLWAPEQLLGTTVLVA